MVGLCKGGNEPPGSLKAKLASHTGVSSLVRIGKIYRHLVRDYIDTRRSVKAGVRLDPWESNCKLGFSKERGSPKSTN
ncbi:hypothetical protein ANN_23642 [Periplaneta americana]|uniref:Uncharacterized protein n=1 Tax=Periplaneta americana TaxID=6978 RepID=A0ABQ8SM41_PERAM|nr:hypothetical protein ANN_23642 [Periplaneta americana]